MNLLPAFGLPCLSLPFHLPFQDMPEPVSFILTTERGQGGPAATRAGGQHLT